MRRADWEERLSDYLAGASSVPFAWGQMDCALFAASAVLAMTDVDIAAPFRGKYKTAIGSAKALRSQGFAIAQDVFSAHFEQVHPVMAKRGDVIEYDNAMGVCIGGQALLLTDQGITRIPQIKWSRAWHVPFQEV